MSVSAAICAYLDSLRDSYPRGIPTRLIRRALPPLTIIADKLDQPEVREFVNAVATKGCGRAVGGYEVVPWQEGWSESVKAGTTYLVFHPSDAPAPTLVRGKPSVLAGASYLLTIGVEIAMRDSGSKRQLWSEIQELVLFERGVHTG